MPYQFILPLLAAVPPNAYGNAQSALHSKGEQSAQIAEIAWVLFIGGGLIFAAVVMLACIALFGPPALRSMLGRRIWITGGGIVFPVVTLSALLLYALGMTASLGEPHPTVRIEVTGELWWWRVRYLDAGGNALFETANEIRIPADTPVEFLLTSADVIHSFWIPNLAGKIDMMPGHVNRLRVRAHAPGMFRGQCAEYCGAQHAKMAFRVAAHGQEEYHAWIAAQTQPARETRDPLLRQGRRLFMDHGCGQCHTVRGTPARGRLGPDLTHFGSRLSLAAGILPNNSGTIAGWITDGQHLKPGNRMPSFNQFSGEDLRALASYLESLE